MRHPGPSDSRLVAFDDADVLTARHFVVFCVAYRVPPSHADRPMCSVQSLYPSLILFIIAYLSPSTRKPGCRKQNCTRPESPPALQPPREDRICLHSQQLPMRTVASTWPPGKSDLSKSSRFPGIPKNLSDANSSSIRSKSVRRTWPCHIPGKSAKSVSTFSSGDITSLYAEIYSIFCLKKATTSLAANANTNTTGLMP